MSYLSVLEAKKREVIDDLEALRAQSAELIQRIALREGQLRNIEELLELEAVGSAGSRAELRSAGSTRFIDVAYELLGTQNEPLHYREIARKVAEQGVRIPGKDPAATLLTAMTRDARFGRGAKRGLYGLSEWPSIQVATRRPRTPTRSRRGAQRG